MLCKALSSFWEGEQQGQFESWHKSLVPLGACRRGEEGCGVRPASAGLLFATHTPREQRGFSKARTWLCDCYTPLHNAPGLPKTTWSAMAWSGSLALATLARSSILLFLTRQAMPLQLQKRHHYNRSKTETSVPARRQELCTLQILGAVCSKTSFSKRLHQSSMIKFSKLSLDADLYWTCHCSTSLEEKISATTT